MVAYIYYRRLLINVAYLYGQMCIGCANKLLLGCKCKVQQFS